VKSVEISLLQERWLQ